MMGLIFLRHAFSRCLAAKAIIAAMESIEADYENLRGVRPKSEYRELDNEVLGQLLRTLNPDELKKVSGDVFGRIYEYFLTQFADQKAHDGRVVIRDFLWSDKTGLPVDAYTEEEVFRHVYRAYPTVPSPYYEHSAVA